MTLRVRNVSTARFGLGSLTPSFLEPGQETDLDVGNSRAEIAMQGIVAKALDADPALLQIIDDTYPLDYEDPNNRSAAVFSGVSVSDVKDIQASPVTEIKMVDQGTQNVVTVTVVNGVLTVTP